MVRAERIRVLLGPSTFGALDRKPLDLLAEKKVEVIDNPYKRKLTKEELLDILGNDVNGLIAGLEPVDREVMEKTALKVVSRCGSGLSNVDLEAAAELGIQVFSTPFGPTNAVAELTIGCLLSLLRRIFEMDRAMHKRKWQKAIGGELRGKRVVIIGFGRIGQRVAELLTPFGARTIAVDPAYKDECHAEKMKLDDALRLADIVTIHSSGEECILGAEEFALMKHGIFLLNAARGSVVDEEALMEAIEEGKVKGAWLDTFSQEPYAGALCDYPQVILTPHVGSYTRECRLAMETEAALRLLEGFGLA